MGKPAWLCPRSTLQALTEPPFYCNLSYMGNTTILVRTKLTEAQWRRIRKIALDRDVPVSQLVADTLRDALLKGAKP